MTYTPIANSEAGLSARNKINGIGTGLDAHIALSGSDVHALGDISNQSASAVNISAGTITPLTTHAGLSGSDAHNLGTMAAQSASAVSISAGTITPLTNHTGLSGSDAHVLGTMAAQSASLVAITGGAIRGLVTVTSASEALTLDATHCVVLASGSESMIISLPTAVGISGRIYHVKKNTSGSSVNVVASGSQTIDGSGSAVITSLYSSVMVVSDGTNWNII
jgi:hypothetical protein